MFLFTYGTLKRGYRNHYLLSDAKFVQEAVTKPLYRLFDLGSFPGLIKDPNGKAISGEIYEIDAVKLVVLDMLEGVPFLYQRHNIELQNFNHPAISYFYQQAVEGYEECGTSWTHN